jgi:hypothetical protein
MTTLDVADITRIARAAANRVSSKLEVLGVTSNGGGSDYVEILIDVVGGRAEGCQLVLGVFRNVDESLLADEVVSRLRQHLHDQLA